MRPAAAAAKLILKLLEGSEAKYFDTERRVFIANGIFLGSVSRADVTLQESSTQGCCRTVRDGCSTTPQTIRRAGTPWGPGPSAATSLALYRLHYLLGSAVELLRRRVPYLVNEVLAPLPSAPEQPPPSGPGS